ncbi:hypothetical protein R6Q57_009172 [Mikania cordata]
MRLPLISILPPAINKCIFSCPFIDNLSPHRHHPDHLLRHLSPANPMADFTLLNVINRVFTALTTFAFALGGSAIGTITGAIKGQTTETGLVRGAGVGAVTGAITALQVMDMMVNGEPFSKVALLYSLLNGKVFTEWVSPAVLKAYQWQTSGMETSFSDMFDVDNNMTRGLSKDFIKTLPKCVFKDSRKPTDQRTDTNCAICLQDFEKEEEGRELPSCGHVFHVKCIDEWLLMQGSCPICRRDV